MSSDNSLCRAGNQRNQFIDFLRGIGAFGVIAIHTAFWSGMSYTPAWFWNLTLFLDVPLFFFLSGWASAYRRADIQKMLKSLAGIWKKWVFFLLVLEILSLALRAVPIAGDAGAGGLADGRDFVNNVFFKVSFPAFPVVAGSIWFMPVYFVVIFGNTLLLALLQRVEPDWDAGIYLWVLIALFLWVYFGNAFFGLDIAEYLFYSAFWMLGYRMKDASPGAQDKKARCAVYIRNAALIIAGIFITNYLQGLGMGDIQSAKFPPSPKYGMVSLLSIETARFLYDIWNKKRGGRAFGFFSHVGRNAVFYYFGQGVGSSLIYYYVSRAELSNWLLKWAGALLLNIALTVVLAETMRSLYALLQRKIRF